MPWRWQDDHGDVVSFAKWGGAPEIVTMFYASCTFRCPLTVAQLKRLESAFARRSLGVNFLLVTLDPRADTPDRLRAFRSSEGLPEGNWHLLAGDDKQTRELGRLLGVHPSYGDPHIDHDVKVGIVDSRGVLLETLDGWHFDEGSVVAAVARGSY